MLRDQDGDRGEAFRLLALARDEAVRLQLPEAPQIEQIIEQIDLNTAVPEAMSDPLLPTEPEAPEVSLRPGTALEPLPTLAVPEPEPLTRGLSGTPTTAPRRAPETEDADYVVWYGTNRRPLEAARFRQGIFGRSRRFRALRFVPRVHPEIAQDRLDRLAVVETPVDDDRRPAGAALGR